MFPKLSILAQPSEIWVLAGFVVAFVALYRLLRGVPFGQAAAALDEDEAPSWAYRRAVIAAVAVGLDLVLMGGYVALTRGIAWSIPFFAVGVGLVTALQISNRKYRHESPSLRRTFQYAGIFLNGALLAGILIIINLVAYRHGTHGFDLTREQTYSLSSLTLNQVETLKNPLTFYMVYGRGTRAARQLDRVAQLLEMYRSANPAMIKLETLNPYTELTRAEDIAKRAPDLAVLQGGGVLIESGEGTAAEFVVVPGQEMFEPVAANRAPENADRFESVFKGEDAITSALIRLRDARKSKVGFITGHGESAISDLNPAGPGIGIWRSRLASVGCETIELNLIKDAIPEDLSLLIIAGPKSPFKPEELTKLTAYAERGGPVLAVVGNTEPSGLEPFLKSFNLEIGRGLVIDRRLNYGNNLQLIFAFLKGGPKHPITASLQSDRAILVPNGAPIHIAGQTAPRGQTSAPVNANLVPSKILVTGPQSWAETDLKNRVPELDKEADEPGPITVGVAVQERAPTGAAGSESPPREGRPRLVLFSSRSLADNIVQGIEPTNLDLVMNAASWLRGRSDAVGIAPKTHVALTLAADSLLRIRLVFVPTVLAILLIIAAGAIVYVARRE
jgi:hypothetical protein